MITVTKIFKFDSAHYLPGYSGKCKNMHGHSFVLEVEVSGTSVKTDKVVYFGMVEDFGDLKRNVQSLIIDELDHKIINDIALSIDGIPPTAEFLCSWIREKLLPIYGDGLERIRLWETDSSFAEWRKQRC